MATVEQTNRRMDWGSGHRCIFTWEEIEYPGCYLEIETGRLYRVTGNVVGPGHSPLFSIVSREPSHYVLLADDPGTPVSLARRIAVSQDYWVDF